MIRRVMGIDVGLARTGVGEFAWDDHNGPHSLTTRLVTSPPAHGIERTVARMSTMIRGVLPAAETVGCSSCHRVENKPPQDLALVVVEEQARGAHNRDDGAVYLGRLLSVLVGRGHPIAMVNPSHLKLWAAQHGHASDGMMRTALERLWPGCMARSDDEVDGALLALAGAQFLRWWQGPIPLKQADPLSRMRWPTMPTASRR